MEIPFDDINYLNIFPYVGRAASFEVISIDASGGNVPAGAYTFMVRYLDEFSTPSNFFATTNQIAVPTTRFQIGADGEDSTSRSIRLRLSNIDTLYDRIQIAVIPQYNGTAGTPLLLPPQVIIGTTMDILFSDPTQGIPSSLEELLIDTASYRTAKTLTQLDDTLYMGNLTRHAPIDYQKFANNIQVRTVTDRYESDLVFDNGPEGVSEGGLRSSGFDQPHRLTYLSKGFKRGEVYAFYISFVLADGQESPAYHIPGRAPTSFTYKGQTFQEDSLLPESEEDLRLISQGRGTTAPGRWFQFISKPHPSLGTGYWENRDEVYPSTSDWDIWDVNSQGEGFFTGQTVRGRNVRHHHMPDQEYVPFDNYPENDNTRIVLGVEFSNIKIPSEFRGRIRGIKIHYAKRNLNNQRILDQVIPVPAKFDTSEATPVYTGETSVVDNDEPQENVVQVHPFNTLRLQQNIEGVTHLRINGIAEETSRNFFSLASGANHQAYEESLRNFNPDVPDNLRFRRVSAQTYIPSYSFNEEGQANSLVQSREAGFNRNFDNTNGEEKILLRLQSAEYFNGLAPSGAEDATPVRAELMQYKENLYLDFDSQELVFSGLQTTNIDMFYPPEASDEENVAEGAIAVRSDASPEASGTQAETALLGFSGTATDGFQLGINITNSPNILISVANGDTASDIVDKIETQVNTTSPGLYDFLVVRESATSFRFRIKSDGDVTQTYTFTTDGSVDDFPYEGIDYSGPSPAISSGGTDPQTGAAGVLSIDLPAGNLISYVVQYGDTRLDIAEALTDEVNATPDYSAELDTSLADPQVLITANSIGQVYNGALSITENEDNITIDLFDLEGGTGETAFTVRTLGGDTFIGVRRYRQSRWLDTDDPVESTLRTVFIESYAYPQYRSAGTQPWEQWASGPPFLAPPSQHAAIIWKDGAPNLTDKEGDRFPADPIRYNIDFLMNETYKQALPFPKRRSEVVDLPTRIIRSRQDDVTDDVDLFRQFRQEDYVDLPRNRGAIHKLSNVNNLLIPHLQRAIFRTRGREELATPDFRAFLGSGDLFEIKPEELYEKDLGHGGLQHTYASVVTEFGYFFVDQQARKVFHLTPEGLADLSNEGMKTMLEERLEFNFEQFGFENTDIFSPFFGVFVGWDPIHERYLLTKKDLKFAEPEEEASPSPSPSPEEELEFDPVTQLFIDPADDQARLPWTDARFEQDSFTLCYYPKLGAWGAFHDYYPDLYCYNTSEIFNIHNSAVYKQEEGDFGRFYGIRYPAVLEYIDNRNPHTSNTVASLFIDSELRNPEGNSVRNKTFTTVRIRNSYQDTGDIPVTFFTDNGNARYANGFWRINQLRNIMTVDGELVSEREWYDKEWLSDRYHYVKLEYDNSENNKLYLVSSQLNMKESLR